MEKKQKDKMFDFKKSLKDFLNDEEGFLSRENILKVGLGTVSAIGILGAFSNSFAGHTSHSNHNNVNYLAKQPEPGTYCYSYTAQHTSHASHTNHGSY